MKITPSFFLLLLLPACTAVRPALPGADAEQGGAFVTLHGADTAAVERFTYAAGQVRSSMVTNRVLQTSLAATITPAQQVSRLIKQNRTYEQAFPADTTRFRADSVGTASSRWAAAPWVDRSVVLLEQTIRYARTRHQSTVRVPVFRTIPQQTQWAVVRFQGRRRAEIELEGRRYLVQLDAQDHVQTAILPAYGMRIQRVPALRASAYALQPLLGAPVGAPYSAEEVHVSARAGHVLAGTLTLPRGGAARKGALVLITGSGQSTRNNGGPPSVPFRQLADELSRAGVAVLRLDDRGTGASTGDWKTSTLQEEANDIEDAVRWLRQRSDIDPTRVGLLGLSEGGIIAPLLGVRDPSLAAIICLAGLGGSGAEMARYQIAYATEHNAAIPPARRDSVIAQELHEARTGPAKVRSIVEYDGALTTARQLRQPLLVLHGANDRQIPPRHAAALAAAARAGGNRDVTVRLFPDLNHIFLPDPDGRAGIQWAYLPTYTLPHSLMATLTPWVTQHLGTR
ncbi:alpha/beta hydrolase family protein [Hymenobacter sp. CRA2]|uniref:alpha/beta hydrolase family protein n=1 Tax=Hymenobacter sp. CRA2 TaxID=1955620 RepID=UPI00098EFC24|nr:alpha/beta hydrolase [Hymenobacter sp. CRA2]OON69677.1 hypothetical protein B0919_07025 [Hymenobacter sp. CRA2]